MKFGYLKTLKQFVRNFHINKLIMTKTSNKNQLTIEELSKAISRDPTNAALLANLKTSNVKFTTLPTPTKSASDKKEYKVIRLENGLTVCLISDKAPIVYEDENSDDEETENEESEVSGESSSDSDHDDEEEEEGPPSPEQKMAAAALCIGVGSFSDPKTVQGLSHFLEHMVFMGSEKYPQENDFDSFISKRGGSDNASTDCEVTTFYFECLEKHFYAALDKFAQFFISPLMKKEAITREREAIESEFQIALPSDGYRKEQLLLCLAKEDTPVNTFVWGNLLTLRDNVDEDELYKKLHEYRIKHYSAHRMTLAIQARLPMEVLQAYVLDCFASVPTNNLPGDNFKLYKDIFSPEWPRLYYVQPNSNITQLDLTWVLPSLLDKYRSKPHHYVASILGDEGKGSLISHLRKKVWALSMTAGNGESGCEHTSMYATFTVNLNLTDEGLAHRDELIELIFGYINMLKELGPIERIYNEIKIIDDMSFRFQVEKSASDTVEELAEAMHYFPPEEYLTGSELYQEYDPEGIRMVLDRLDARKMNVMILTNDLPKGKTFDRVEKWFGTKYMVQDVPEEWLKQWENAKPHPDFAVPEPNQYLSTNYDLLPKDQSHPDYPQRIHKTDLVEIWYRKDQKFELPAAYYYLHLISPEALKTPLNLALRELMQNIFLIHIVEEGYPATVAQLYYEMKPNEKGLTLKLSGYNEKLHVLLELATKHILNFNNYLTADMFEAVKDKLIKHYYNLLLKPSFIAKQSRMSLLVDKHTMVIDAYNVVSSVTIDMLKKFASDFIKSMYVKVLIQGNVTKAHSIEIIEKMMTTLNPKPIAPGSYPQFRVIEIPKGQVLCRLKSFNPTDANSIITNYYQAGPFSYYDNVIIETILLIIQEPLFDTLRTKEQLGYNVNCAVRDTYGILGYTITVNAQATKNTTQYVHHRIDEFVKSATNIINNTSAKQFEEIKKDLIKTKQCCDVHLKEEMDRNWEEIIEDDYMFDRLKQEIKAIEMLKINDVKKWWKSHNSKENMRKLSVQVVGYDRTVNGDSDSMDNYGKRLNLQYLGANGDDAMETIKDVIFDIAEFKKAHKLYPAVVSDKMIIN